MPSDDAAKVAVELTSALAASADPEVRVVTGLSPVARTARLMAPAYTVKGRTGDNLALHHALASAPAGSVIVAELEGSVSAGHWGELMTQAAQVRGLAGLVLAATIRDVVDIERLGFAVFHRGTDPRQTSKLFPGQLEVPVRIMDTLVEPGDLICADVDGIAVVPRARIDAVRGEAMRIADKERRAAERIQAGETTLEVFSLPSR
jgi:4-hydroxy-4-methyl-2-oxoglutarate aldolase